MSPATPDPAAPSFAIRKAPEPAFAGRISATTLTLADACERRLWLSVHRAELAAPPGDFDRLLWDKGRAHERVVRETRFAAAAGPVFHGQPAEDAAAETLRLLHAGAAALYQPLFLSPDGRRVGVPDFVYREDGGLVLHDAKLAVRLDNHPEIRLQMTHYARLLAEGAGVNPARLEITNGAGEVATVAGTDEAEYDAALARATALIGDAPEPTRIQSHSVCADCPFYDHCWTEAVAQDRIEVLRDVTRPVAAQLHDLGFHTIRALAAAAPEDLRVKGIASTAGAILAEARAHRDRRPVWLAPPALPPWPVVWFDLEGDPEGEELDRAIYLWGLALDDGRDEPRAEAITADFSDQGGRRAWERFVARAGAILERHPDAHWVHYSPYEKTWLRNYAATFGAPDGFLERIKHRLFDLLHRGVRRSVRLPLYSYSIKQVAKLAGFRWRNPDSGSVWSIVQYQKARASADPEERARRVREIEEYNADDLLAMRAVWRWMQREGPRTPCG